MNRLIENHEQATINSLFFLKIARPVVYSHFD
jgi:hypothetical protein